MESTLCSLLVISMEESQLFFHSILNRNGILLSLFRTLFSYILFSFFRIAPTDTNCNIFCVIHIFFVTSTQNKVLIFE